MRPKRRAIHRVWLLLLLVLPAVAPAQWTYTTNNGTLTITKFTGQFAWVTVPNSIGGVPVTRIGDLAFNANNYVMGVTIPFSITNIGYSAFGSCMNLLTVTCYDGLANIGDYAFDNCANLTSINIPSTVTNIGNRAFGACVALPSIDVAAGNAFYTNVAGIVLNKSQTRLVACPGGKAGNYTMPGSVTSIGFAAFVGCTNLTSITMPHGVTNIAVSAFSDCYNLTTITMSSNLTSIAGYIFNYCRKLKRITIPVGVTSIGDYAFNACTALEGVYFKTNPPTLGSAVFDADDNTTIYYLPGNVGWGATFGGRPTAVWRPQLVMDAGTGVISNQFKFRIDWAGGRSVVVEARTNMATGNWQPIKTNSLTDDASYFADPQWINHSSRFYHLRWP